MQREDGETVFEAVSWTLERPWANGIEARISGAVESWRTLAQTEAAAIAAAEVRAIRDTLLKESDAMMALDRLGLVVPTGTSFTSWLSFLRGIGDMLSGKAATYRKALRDLTEQPGFPFEIDWPEQP